MTILNIIQVTLQFFCAVALTSTLSTFWYRRKIISRREQALCLLALVVILLLLSDSLAYVFRGSQFLTGRVIVRISNFGVFFFEDIMHVFFAIYTVLLVEEKGGKVNPLFIQVVTGITVIGVFMLIVTQFTDFYYTIDPVRNEYARSGGIIVNYILHFLLIIVEVCVLLKHAKEIGKRKVIIAASFFSVIIITTLFQLLMYGISFTNIGLAFSAMLLMIEESFYRTEKSIRQMQLLMEQEKNAEDMRRRLLLSSIQPHFLFNSLNAIEGLIMIDQEKAIEAVADISRFLRASVDTLNSDVMIPVSKELRIVKSYLSLMELRFWGAVVIKIDDSELSEDYMIPPFTLQPLAENAIHHGIRKRKDGQGTLSIRFHEEEDCHMIILSDDGVGFEDRKELMEKPKGEENVHVGRKIVQERLSLMCGGKLTIHSEPGKGTSCEIRIPKNKQNP